MTRGKGIPIVLPGPPGGVMQGRPPPPGPWGGAHSLACALGASLAPYATPAQHRSTPPCRPCSPGLPLRLPDFPAPVRLPGCGPSQFGAQLPASLSFLVSFLWPCCLVRPSIWGHPGSVLPPTACAPTALHARSAFLPPSLRQHSVAPEQSVCGRGPGAPWVVLGMPWCPHSGSPWPRGERVPCCGHYVSGALGGPLTK